MKSALVASIFLFSSTLLLTPCIAYGNDNLVAPSTSINGYTNFSAKTRSAIDDIKAQSSVEEVKKILRVAMKLRSEKKYAEFIAIWTAGAQWFENHPDYGPEHPLTSGCIREIGNAYAYWGKDSQAIDNYKKSISIIENASFPSKIRRLLVLNNQTGLAYARMGDNNKSILHYEKALDIASGYKDKYGKQMSTTMFNLALAYKRVGKSSFADQMLEDSLRIRIKEYGNEHLQVASVLAAQADLFRSLGLNERALGKAQLAYDISVKNSGEDHPFTIDVKKSLAWAYVGLKMYDKSIAIREQILIAARKNAKAYPNDPKVHLQLSKELAGVAMEKMFIREFPQAEKLMKEAIAVASPYVSGNDRHSLGQLSQYAYLKRNQGDQETANELRKQRHEILLRTQDTNSITFSYLERGEIAAREGDYIRAEGDLRIAIDNQVMRTIREVPFLPRSYRQNTNFSTLTDVLPNIAARLSWGYWSNPSDSLKALADLGFYERINRHGLVAEVEKIQSQFLSLSGNHQPLVSNLNAITSKLANLSISTKKRQQLLLEREDLERRLYRLLPSIRHELVSLDDLAKSLPNDGVLIEFLKYKYHYDNKSNRHFGSNITNGDRYIAMILKPDGKTSYVDLGAASTIDESVARTSSAIAKLYAADRELERMAQLVIEPLLDSIGGAKTWFVSPDGELNRLPFAALRDTTDGNYLSNKLNVNLLTTGRELLSIKRANSQSNNKTLVIANPDFDREILVKSSSGLSLAQEEDTPLMRSSALGREIHWAQLPGTKIEGKQIAAITGGDLLMQNNATVNQVKKARSPKILHLATHAFYLPDQKRKAKPKSTDNDGNRGGVTLGSFLGEDPLLRSGIALTGANNPELDPSDDGYLTALEFARLDLDGTDLVVVSACQSGLGDIQRGEGVYGLKRAIAVAGSQSSLLSLWLVDDAATAAFMSSFYQKLSSGMEKAAALRQTQEQFRNHDNLQWRQPYVWAAFQLSGDWGPIHNF